MKKLICLILLSSSVLFSLAVAAVPSAYFAKVTLVTAKCYVYHSDSQPTLSSCPASYSSDGFKMNVESYTNFTTSHPRYELIKPNVPTRVRLTNALNQKNNLLLNSYTNDDFGHFTSSSIPRSSIRDVTIYRVVPIASEQQHDGGVVAYCGNSLCNNGVFSELNRQNK